MMNALTPKEVTIVKRTVCEGFHEMQMVFAKMWTSAYNIQQFVATMNVLTAEEVTVVEESVHEDLNGMRMATVQMWMNAWKYHKDVNTCVRTHKVDSSVCAREEQDWLTMAELVHVWLPVHCEVMEDVNIIVIVKLEDVNVLQDTDYIGITFLA